MVVKEKPLNYASDIPRKTKRTTKLPTNKEQNFRKKFIRNIAVLMSGKVLSRVFTIAITPILTRLFSPHDFGIAALFISVTLIITSFSSLKFEQAIVLPNSNREAKGLLYISLIALSLTSILTISGIIFINLFFDISSATALGFWLYLIPLAIFFRGFINIANSVNTRTESYKLIATGDFLEATTTGTARLVFGKVGTSSPGGLITGYLLGIAIRTAALSKSMTKFLFMRHKEKWNIKSLYELSTDYREFPIHAAPTGLIREVYTNLPVIMLSIIFTPFITGLYALSVRLVKMPVIMLSDAVRRVFMKQASDTHNNNDSLIPSLYNSTKLLAGIGLIIFFPLFIYGAEIFSFVLGSKWEKAGIFTSIISPWLYMVFLQAPSTSVYTIYRKQKHLLQIRSITLFISISMFFIVYISSFSEITALILFSLISTISQIIIIFIAFRIALKKAPIKK